jgi:hypothetical protein
MSLAGRIFAERRAVMVPLVLFLGANVGVLLGVVWPMQRAVNGADEARYQATMSLAAARKIETEWKAKRSSKDRADLELRKFYSEILPTSFAGARGVANFFLQTVAAESKLVLRSGQWEPAPLKDSRLTRVSGTVTLLGDYASVRRFLYEVETAQEFVVIERVELSEANSTQNDNRLELTLSVATYYVTDRNSTVVSR